jgi:hypothetical protein
VKQPGRTRDAALRALGAACLLAWAAILGPAAAAPAAAPWTDVAVEDAAYTTVDAQATPSLPNARAPLGATPRGTPRPRAAAPIPPAALLQAGVRPPLPTPAGAAADGLRQALHRRRAGPDGSHTSTPPPIARS